MGFKKIICGVVLGGLCWMGVSDAATLRNKPASKTKTEAMWDAFDDTVNTTGTYVSVTADRVAVGTETVTMSNHTIGYGTTTNSKHTTYVITDATGADADQLNMIDGTVVGQTKRVVLWVDAETTGLAVVPETGTLVGGAGTSTLLEDAGDSITYEWSGATGGWIIVSNEGGSAL